MRRPEFLACAGTGCLARAGLQGRIGLTQNHG
jgi:hypothetical protein